MAMQDEQLKETIRALLEEQRVAVLATDMEGRPYTTLVGFWAGGDLSCLYFATTRSTRKFAALSANARVSMLIDNRTNRSEDFRDAVAVTAQGQAEEVDKAEFAAALRSFIDKHPHLAEFVASPTCAFVRVAVETYNVVTRFQHVMVLRVGQ
jgi:nitroimidazol reductase NimA-like FMN-containing flavoprotein (pyridoxamine 5'-phosphate oxidase superfamily)